MSKRIMSWILVVAMIWQTLVVPVEASEKQPIKVDVTTVGESTEEISAELEEGMPAIQQMAAGSSYNASAALAYAKKNWNVNAYSILCAEFVSNCLKAGGAPSTVWSKRATVLRSQLNASGMGKETACSFSSDGYLYKSNCPSDMAPGDVVFYYCPSCDDGKPYSIHVVMCNGFDSNGRMKAYSHNGPSDGINAYRYGTKCYDCNRQITTVHVYHFKGNTTNHLPKGAIDSVTGGNGTISIYGWAMDEDSTNSAVNIHVYIGGAAGTSAVKDACGIIYADKYRSDVGWHGYNETWKVSARGSQPVYIYAIDVQDPSKHTLLGKKTVTINEESYSITYGQSKLDMINGKTANLNLSFTGIGIRSFGYSWTGSKVVEVTGGEANLNNGTGVFNVKAVQPGESTLYIHLMDGNGKTLYEKGIPVIVKQPVSSVTLNKSTLNLEIGQTSTLTATVKPSNATNKSVKWSSSNTSVATVSNGKITAKAAGNTTITVKTSDGSYTATCKVTVKNPVIAVNGIVLSKSSLLISEGTTSTLTATVKPSNATNKSVKWSSSNTSVATVSNGKITAKAIGTADITAKTSDGGYTATCKVTVKSKVIPITGITISKTTLKLTEGDKGTLTAKVSPSNATNASVTWSSSNPSVATVSNGTVIAKGAGTTTITVRTDDGGYIDTCKVTVEKKVKEEVPKEESVPEGLWIKGLQSKVFYTGKAVKQNVQVYYKNVRLREGADYMLSYKNNIKAGTAQLIVNGKGNYRGKAIQTFEIEAVDISKDKNISVSVATAKENGKKLKPVVTVKWNGKKLVEKTDYVLHYNSRIVEASAEGYDVVIEGIGNFTGSVTEKFYVQEKQTILLNGATVTGIKKSYKYENGNPAGPHFDSIMVKVGKKTLIQDVDYTVELENNYYPGTGRVVIEGVEENGYAGKKVISFGIIGVDLKKGTIGGLSKTYSYTGEAIEPEVVVFKGKNTSGEIISADCYEVTYRNNINKGTATVMVTGIEEKGYSGSIKATYQIRGLNLNDSSVDILIPKSSVYAKGGSKPKPVITYENNGSTRLLIEGVDYSLSYVNNKAINSSKSPIVKISGIGNFSGTVTKTFCIEAQDISKLTVTVADKTYKPEKRGNYYFAIPQVYDLDGKLLKKNTDYTLEYVLASTGQKIDTYTAVKNGAEIQVIVTGKGNYNGTTSATYFVRNLMNIGNVKHEKIVNQPYTGSQIKPEVKMYVTNGNSKVYLTEGVDYKIIGYYNNIKRGTSSVIVKGIGEYSGSKTITFKIVSADNGKIWSGSY